MNPSLVYLVQTDTTVGFSSKDKEKLADIKKRPRSQKILQTLDSFKTLKNQTRIPNKYKKIVRNSCKSTFIYPNGESYRVISKEFRFYDFIKKFGILYSSSANETKKSFNKEYAVNHCDILVENPDGFFEDTPSSLYILSKKRIKKIR